MATIFVIKYAIDYRKRRCWKLHTFLCPLTKLHALWSTSAPINMTGDFTHTVNARRNYDAGGMRWRRITTISKTIEIKSLVSRGPKKILRWQRCRVGRPSLHSELAHFLVVSWCAVVIRAGTPSECLTLQSYTVHKNCRGHVVVRDTVVITADSPVWFSLTKTKTKMVKDEKITNSLTKTKRKRKNDEN